MATTTLRVGILPFRTVLVLASFCVMAAARTATAQTPVEVGFRDFSYGPTPTAKPSGERPQSKLWWNDGVWWGSLFSPSVGRYHIHRLEPATNAWIDTGVPLDDRPNSKADVLWEPANSKLYVASNYFSSYPAASTSTSRWGRLYRYSYLSAQGQYVLDPGFPVTITKGSAEALTIARDTAGRLWVTWVENGSVKINYSLSNDLEWNTPADLPVATAGVTSPDDISAVLAFGGGRVGVMWSNQDVNKTYFAVHRDVDAPTVWQPVEPVMPGCSGLCSDDHISLTTDSSGQVFAVIKTSFTQNTSPLIVLAVRNTLGVWTNHTVGVDADHHTRPIVLLAEDSNQLFVFATQPEAGGSIYFKSTPLGNISFAPGLGTMFMDSSSDPAINNVTSTKGSVTQASGIVALATDGDTRRYLHNSLSLSGVSVTSFTPSSGPAGTLVLVTGSGFSGATAVTFNGTGATFAAQSDTSISTSVPAGATTGRIVVSTRVGTATSATDFVVTSSVSTSLKDATFENGNLIDATTGVDRVNGSVSLETGSPLIGVYSARIANGSDAYLEERFTDAGDLVVSVYIRVDALPGSDIRILLVSNAGTTVGNMTLRTNGALRLRLGSTIVGQDSPPLAVGQVYRIALRQRVGTGSDAILEAFVAPGDQEFNGPFASLLTGTWTSVANRVRVGVTVLAPLSMTLDSLQVVALSMSPPPALRPSRAR